MGGPGSSKPGRCAWSYAAEWPLLPIEELKKSNQQIASYDFLPVARRLMLHLVLSMSD